ncbi:hypothetical protein BJ878DRAFT_488562 [Calycina marina]|uniref:Uncharacterized protein n=1 Tax=Calycina marina TaxID=1763456 RepID=A0A9P8CIH5_9HELO|nr:hypothetical protein BJ878DRAFT_488562 [Calycina marina]
MSSRDSFESGSMDSPITPDMSTHLLQPSQENVSILAGASFNRGGASSHRLNSPAGLSSSITPPPSSQFPYGTRQSIISSIQRTSTPAQPRLSSPPLTTVNETNRDVAVQCATPSVEQLGIATKEELREYLNVVLGDNKTLEAAAAEARMSAAHYKLQHNLLTIETEEATARMEVEHLMTVREVDVLQRNFNGPESPYQDYVAKVKAYCYQVEQERDAFSHKLTLAMKVIERQDDEVASWREREQLLLRRIRENREHLNYLRSPGGLFHIPSPKAPTHSYPSTPQQYRSTPRGTPMTGRSRQGCGGSQEPFAALLLADQMLNQEDRDNNSAPSTPLTNRRMDHRTPVRHSRGVQSLSSLPTTPRSAVRGTPGSTLLPSVQFSRQTDPRERRRRSRDSTISLSDNEEIARAAMSSFRGENEEVYESQASQTAMEMLRIDPHESFEVEASRTNTPNLTTDKSKLHQSKIYGAITKGVGEKRKRGDDERSDMSKKFRAGEDIGIGLGIGFDARAELRRM